MIHISMKGQKQALSILRAAEKLVQGAAFHGAYIKATKRELGPGEIAEDKDGDGDFDNADVMKSLIMQGRDFFQPQSGELEEIAQAFADKVDEQFHLITKSKEVGEAAMKKAANQVSGSAWRAAMAKYLSFVIEHINNGQFVGDGDTELSPGYEQKKIEKFKFAYPIGKASGQLLGNLSVATKGIKLMAGKS